MRISSVGTALPQHRFSQAEVTDALRKRWRASWRSRACSTGCTRTAGWSMQLRAAAGGIRGPARVTNDVWISAAAELGQTCIDRALTPLGLTAADVSAIFLASTTGTADAALDARLINRCRFRSG